MPPDVDSDSDVEVVVGGQKWRYSWSSNTSKEEKSSPPITADLTIAGAAVAINCIHFRVRAVTS
jgi:hypothetical protein